MKNILCLPDLHLPAMDADAVRWAAHMRNELHCDIVVQLGDFADQRIWSRFPADPDFDNPSLELELLIDSAGFLHKVFPEMHLLLGNHDGRWIKRAMQAGLPTTLVRSLHEVLPYKGWKWHTDTSPLIIQKTAFIHGDEMTGTCGLKASRLGMNTVMGHSHQGRLEFIPMFDKLIWGMECGCLVDESSSAFRYAAKNPRRQFKGLGAVLDGDPYLFTYPGRGKWGDKTT